MTQRIKGQTAMEYLMTYGWAILIIIIVAAALFALGVFNPGTFTQQTAVGFPQLNVPAGGWELDSTGPDFRITFSNQAGGRINVTSVKVKIGTTTGDNTSSNLHPTGGIQLSPGEETTVFITSTLWDSPLSISSGASYSAEVTIQYTFLNTGTKSVSVGRVTGSAI